MSVPVTEVESPRLTVTKSETALETVLSTNNLTKHFGRIKAVNNLNLEVRTGQVFGMLGPNGSGKTTTLGMLMGVVNPTAGEFRWFGEPATPEVRRRIGAVLEHPIFYPYLTGQKNLELNAMVKQCPSENISKVLEIVELTERRNDKYKTYSLGMKQRLAIASALLNDPTVLILDEPTNGLDPMGIAEIRELIKKIAANGKTIILASHLLDEVQKVCTHFCVLKKGNLVHIGPVNDFGGAETVEVNAEGENFPELLIDFQGTSTLNRENGAFVVSLKEGYHSKDLNNFLFEKGIVANHLVTRKKSLEKMFLEILSESR
jgi:ABC-type multidrug transport system ATPase subunit